MSGKRSKESAQDAPSVDLSDLALAHPSTLRETDRERVQIPLEERRHRVLQWLLGQAEQLGAAAE